MSHTVSGKGEGEGQVIFDICIEYKLCRAFQHLISGEGL